MLNLPKHTEIKRQLPKTAVFAKFEMNNAAKERIDSDISRMTLVNEITSQNVNIAAGESVKSFYVLHALLKRRDFSEKTVADLIKIIPQNILFVLEFDGEARLAAYRAGTLCLTAWKSVAAHKIELNGFNLDDVWQNIITYIGGIEIEQGNTLDEQIEADKKREAIEKKIETLKKKLRREKQFNRKTEINAEIKRLKRELESMG